MSSAASNFRNHRHQQLWPRGLSLSSIPPKFHYLSLLSPTQCVSILPVEFALSLEKLANEKLLLLHSVAEKNKDVLLIDFVETEFLAEQVEAFKKISEYVQLRIVRKGHGMLLLRDDVFVAVESDVMLSGVLIVAV
ncbi:ferritin-3, chloroplastic-like isoform X3 [Pyrus x bretschneideri]|uniref:ferritin-3, chloroplastic-like isoform X3 n=1 Tax=Pyrus x bretschneideri TaxID=225117 RepID=UPI00202F7DF4|nr:ferritin-3, chloroplastic-like isoform X3 [Pyrus x bretschneideri]